MPPSVRFSVKARLYSEDESFGLNAVRYDRQFRASIGAGIPASAIPAGSTYAEAMLAAELDSRTYQPHRATIAEDLFDNSGTLTFHPYSADGDES